MAHRALQGVLAVLLWTALAYLVGTLRTPAWMQPIAPLPGLALAVDAAGPGRPILARLQIRLPRIAGSVLIVASSILLLWEILPTQPYSDQPLTIVCAARALLKGVDPYTTFEPQCAKQLDFLGVQLTVLATGPFTGQSGLPTAQAVRAAELRDQNDGLHTGFPGYGYPPNAVLTVLPVAFLGWHVVSIWIMGLSVALLLAGWGFRRGPPAFDLLLGEELLALALMSTAFSLGWDPEYVAYLLLAIAVSRFRSPVVSSTGLAAAVSINELCWVALPVLVAMMLRQPDRRQRFAWLVGAGVVLTVPWLFWLPGWPLAVLKFLQLPLVSMGESIGAIGVWPPGSALYLVAMASWLVLCAALALWRPWWSWAALLASWGCFVLGSRGLGYYFLPAFWLGPAALLGAWRLSSTSVWRPALGSSPVPSTSQPGQVGEVDG